MGKLDTPNPLLCTPQCLMYEYCQDLHFGFSTIVAVVFRAGIRAGSIIQKINGKPVETSSEVFEAVNTNSRLQITLLQKTRLSQYEEVTIVVEPMPVTRPTL